MNIGIIPEPVSSYLLPCLVGFQGAKEIMYFRGRIPAQQLFGLRLVNRLYPETG